MRRRLCSAAVLLVLLGAVPSPASAASTDVCVFRAAVHDTPRGLVIGYLHEGARVRLIGRTEGGRWYRIRGPLRLVGWLKARHICR